MLEKDTVTANKKNYVVYTSQGSEAFYSAVRFYALVHDHVPIFTR